MKADALLSRLEKVKRTGAGQWIACCPAHDDRSPSMSVRELDDGRVLLHCFGGCAVESILSAAGLTFEALFPDRAPDAHRPQRTRRQFHPGDVLACIATEALIVAVAASCLRQGLALSDQDHERLIVAAGRIQAAREVAIG